MRIIPEITNYFIDLKRDDPKVFEKRRDHGEKLLVLLEQSNANNVNDLISHIDYGIKQYKGYLSHRYSDHLTALKSQLNIQDPNQLEKKLNSLKKETSGLKAILAKDISTAEFSTDISLQDKPTAIDKESPEKFGFLFIPNLPVQSSVASENAFKVLSSEDLLKQDIFNDAKVKKFVANLKLIAKINPPSYYPSLEAAEDAARSKSKFYGDRKSSVIFAIPKAILDNPKEEENDSSFVRFKNLVYDFNINDIATIYFTISADLKVVNPNFDRSKFEVKNKKGM